MASNGKSYSFQTGHRNSFGVLDYVIFAGTLLFSAGIGVFYAVKDRKKKNIKDFLMAGGNMHLIPVAMSLLATFMSAITMLGTPAEMYNFTTQYMWIGLGYVGCIFLAAHVFLPVFYKLRLTSTYEYLEKRFSKGVRTLGTCIFSLQMLIYMAIVLYAPSLALNAVTGLSLWGSVAAIGVVCTFYTTLGGMKAVLWTDTFQASLMMIGVMAALIQGCIELGGFSKAWQIAAENGRVEFTNFSPYLTTRHSFWALTIGGTVLWVSNYGTNQAQVQRALTCGSLRHAQIALWLNVPGLWIILGLCCLVGVVMYAFYSQCDPIKFGLINASDQLFPLFVMDVLGHIPGLPGLFVASIFSGSLSTMSSGLNSMAVVILQDIMRPYFCTNMTESRATWWSRILAVIFGLICLGLTWVASKLGGILQAALSLFGMLGAPMLGLFTLGILFPWANKWGAYSGLLCSLGIMFWLGIGTHFADVTPARSPVRTDGCNWTLVSGLHSTVASNGEVNQSFSKVFDTVRQHNFAEDIFNATTIPTPVLEEDILDEFYKLSYLWYSTFAVLIVLVVGMIVSLATGCQDPKDLDPRLVQPICSIVCPFFPRAWLKHLHCGVPHHKRHEWEEQDKASREKLHTDKVCLAWLQSDIGHEISNKDGIIYETETLTVRPILKKV